MEKVFLTLLVFCKLVLITSLMGCNQQFKNDSVNNLALQENLEEYFNALYQMDTFISANLF